MTDSLPTTLDLGELRALFVRATPLEWRVGFEDGTGRNYIVRRDEDDFVVVSGANDSYGIAQGVLDSTDAALIVAAVNALPALLDEIDRLRGSGGIGEPATSEEYDPRIIDVDALRRAIYAVSVRHDWANTTDREDQTEEIAASYTSFYAALGSPAPDPLHSEPAPQVSLQPDPLLSIVTLPARRALAMTGKSKGDRDAQVAGIAAVLPPGSLTLSYGGTATEAAQVLFDAGLRVEAESVGGLDRAWGEAEAALPDDAYSWRVRSLVEIAFAPMRWEAVATNGKRVVKADGHTPTLALHALALALGSDKK